MATQLVDQGLNTPVCSEFIRRYCGPAEAVGYMLVWLMGVPASVLVVIYLIHGHH